MAVCAKLQITLLKSMAGCSFEAIVEEDLEEDTDETEVSLLYSICIFSTSCCLKYEILFNIYAFK